MGFEVIQIGILVSVLPELLPLSTPSYPHLSQADNKIIYLQEGQMRNEICCKLVVIIIFVCQTLYRKDSDAREPSFAVFITGSKMMANVRIIVTTVVSAGPELTQSQRVNKLGRIRAECWSPHFPL